MCHLLRLALLLAAFVVLSSSGCSGCGDQGCPETPCADGEVCTADGACVLEQRPCEPACGDDEVCSGGRCIPLDAQCAAIGETCDPSLPVAEGFLCIDWDGGAGGQATCSPFCQGAQAVCPTGSNCFALQSAADRACNETAPCADGQLCLQGTCRYVACRASTCSGFLTGQPTCQNSYDGMNGFEFGAKCYPFDNAARYCYPAGPRAEGQACETIDEAARASDYSAVCGVGLACVGGTCRVACADDADCSGGDCLQVGAVDLDVGFCATGCEPFTEGACGAGQTCLPDGEGAGYCVQAGGVGPFEACEIGAGQCAPGTRCVAVESGNSQPGEGRCAPICDVGAAATNEQGELGPAGQATRDATCPQPPVPQPRVRLAHLAPALGPVDVYLDDARDPLAAGLGFGTVASPGGSAWFMIPPGPHTWTVLSAGAPRSDIPIARVDVTVQPGQARLEVLASPGLTSAEDVRLFHVLAPQPLAVDAPDVAVRAIHAVADLDAVDVIAVAEGHDPTDAAAQVELAAGLQPGAAGVPVAVVAGRYDIYMLDAGAARADPAATARAVYAGVGLDQATELGLVGTLDPDDVSADQAVGVAMSAVAADTSQGPTYTCVDLGNGGWGYCQQVCPAGAQAFDSDVCLGEAMGCAPTLRKLGQGWQTLCAPVGEGQQGATCDPQAVGQCAEGLYCLAYGNTAAHSASGQSGLCTAYCDPGGDGARCASGQSCQPIVYDGSYGVGRCGWSCQAGPAYTDASCPTGLQTCEPLASLQEDPTGQAAGPVVRDEQPFCAASGDVAEGAVCTNYTDCVPGAECLFERSRQSDFVSTLLSPYFGAAGLTPRCTAQCDPFDADSAAHTCPSGQTCLFNYPWSAEVGHCAEIVAPAAPGESCSQPGLACGEDSICVINGGPQVCIRFCDYAGPDSRGQLRQSTCPANYECAPFVGDIGFCRARQ